MWFRLLGLTARSVIFAVMYFDGGAKSCGSSLEIGVFKSIGTLKISAARFSVLKVRVCVFLDGA